MASSSEPQASRSSSPLRSPASRLASSSSQGSRPSSPARSVRSRMGTMLRRTSAGLSFSKSVRQSNSKGSLKVDPAQAPPDSMVPSPVVESPAREAAAENSPVATVPESSSSLPQPPTNSGASTAKPGTDPVPALALEPAAVTSSPEQVELPLSSAPAPQDVTPSPALVKQSSVSVAGTTSADRLAVEQTPATAATMPAPEAIAPPARNETSLQELVASAGPQEPAIEKQGPDYFAWGDGHTLAPNWSESSLKNQDVPREPAVPSRFPQEMVTAQTPVQAASPRVNNAEAFAWKDDLTQSLSPKQSLGSIAASESGSRSGSPLPPRSGRVSARVSGSSLASSFGQVYVSKAGRQISVSMDPDDGEFRRGRSPGPSVRISFEDPFADPINQGSDHKPIPKPSALSPIESINSPVPERSLRNQLRQSTISFPLPSQHDGIATSSVQQVPSAYSLDDIAAGSDQTQVQHETDERLPLLQRSASPRISNGKSKAAIPFPAGQLVSVGANSAEALGWMEHTLPDSSVYFTHADLHVVTDIDLRNAKKLAAVTEYLKKMPEDVALPSQGWELWLRDAGKKKQGFKPLRNWVSHKARILSFDPPPTVSGESLAASATDDDKLDLDYRYWAFLEGHPAHTPLSPESRAEALDALTWSYTDCLLPSSRPVPPPFAPQECQELMGLLRSVDSTAGHTSIVQTRIIARVLLRVAQWRQHYFRPNRPLPQDVSKGGRQPERRRSLFLRAMVDLFLSVLCLGIPYLFYARARDHRMDEESGLHSAGPMLVIGACACLVAAVILSASVTFISLPGLDDISRLAALLAILFSASSMVSAVIALFRYRADAERAALYVGGEGLLLLSRRSVVMSLPLVFLAWAIAAFITGITLYSFHGVTLTSRMAVAHPFGEYTHWTVVGTVGGLATVLAVATVLAR